MALNECIGSRLRHRRKEIGLSLRQLADMIGVTASFLSQVENSKTNVALKSLQKLSEALAVPLLYFLSEVPSKESAVLESHSSEEITSDVAVVSPVVEVNSRAKLILSDSKITYELLIPDLGRKMVAICGRLSPGTGNVARRLREPTEEFIYILSGELRVSLSSGEHTLTSGDTIYFEGEKLQQLYCASKDEDAVWVSVITPAVF